MTLPVYLISGLLGSGKSTCLHHLIQQKPPGQNWAVLVNEFGEIDIDAAALRATADHVIIESVSGGCICCSAQFTLSQALQRLIQQPNLDALFIEPTGLGHPAKIIDTLKTFTTLQLRKTVCLITPAQLNMARWEKSQVLRDLVTLADIVLLNKTDLSQAAEIAASETLLASLYPPKTVLRTQMGRINLAQITQFNATIPPSLFRLQTAPAFTLQKITPHQALSATWPSELPDCLQASLQTSSHDGQILAIGWQFSARTLFNRNALKQWFNEFGPQLQRAKGLLRTGNEWQLLNYSDSGLQLSDIAWRQDSLIECLFREQGIADHGLIQKMEAHLLSVISLR